MEYLVFVQVDGRYKARQGETQAYIRCDVPPFATLADAKQWVYTECLRSRNILHEFRIFEEYEIYGEVLNVQV